MLRFVANRLLWTIPVLWLVATVTFALMHVAPGSPWDARASGGGRQLDPALEAAFNRHYGLDQPLAEQYLRYMRSAIRLDFGESYSRRGKSVADVIGEGFPHSARIGVAAFVLALAIGLPVGTLAALKHNTAFDYGSLLLATISYTVPDFVIAIVLLLIFAVQFDLLPVLFTDWRSYILPSIALGTGGSAYLARLTRASVLETLRQEHVRTARAKGLRARTVIGRHVLRNGLIPVVTLLGPSLVALITGTIIIERVFGVPGMGYLFIDSVTTRDYPVIMGVTIFYAVLIVFANLLVDILYGVVDPRIRVGS